MGIKLQSKTIPQSPGVYRYSAKGIILYVGKANNLRARIKSYFAKNLPTKTSALMEEATDLAWEVVGSEVEALIRESELIKKYRPKYNILMRDDKQYLYVGFTLRQGSGQAREQYPKIFVTHQLTPPTPPLRKGRKKEKLFISPPLQGVVSGGKNSINFIGPFTESGAIKSTLKMLRRIFPYCTCKQPHKTPCLNARIGRCLGYCCTISPPYQGGALGRWVSKNKFTPPTPPLRKGRKTENITDNLMAEYKSSLTAIKKILTGKNKSLLKSLQKEMRSLSKKQHYEEAGKIRNQVYALEKIFAHSAVIKKDLHSDRSRAIHALENILKTKNISRIEGYDISNIHGNFAYGSMVVFIDGLPRTDLYRIFKIRLGISKKSHLGVRHLSNDPAMIYEIISRRLRHPEWPYPDVMLIDGGPTQLTAALSAKSQNHPPLPPLTKGGKKEKLPISPPLQGGGRVVNTTLPGGIKIISLAKREEELYLSPHQKPIKIKGSSETLYSLLTHIRNESHRFAIKHYRKAHNKKLLS